MEQLNICIVGADGMIALQVSLATLRAIETGHTVTL